MAIPTSSGKRSQGLGVRQWLSLALYGLGAVVARRHRPIVAGVPLTNFCNLSCRHCVVRGGNGRHNSLPVIRGWMEQLYAAGARFLYLQGGEILTWRDGGHGPSDVIALARSIGYFRVAAVTNGTLPIALDADAVWVSIDGPESVHDAIRGAGSFALLRKNVEACDHPRLYANLTLNKINAGYVLETVEEIARMPAIRGISVNFHTPYCGVEDLALSEGERLRLSEALISLKRGGTRILNSFAGLKALGSGRYRRPSWMIRLVEQGRIFECCFGREERGVCERCGYGIIAELAMMARMRPSALLHGFSLFL